MYHGRVGLWRFPLRGVHSEDRTSFTGTQNGVPLGAVQNIEIGMFVAVGIMNFLKLEPMTTGDIALKTAIFAEMVFRRVLLLRIIPIVTISVNFCPA